MKHSFPRWLSTTCNHWFSSNYRHTEERIIPLIPDMIMQKCYECRTIWSVVKFPYSNNSIFKKGMLDQELQRIRNEQIWVWKESKWYELRSKQWKALFLFGEGINRSKQARVYSNTGEQGSKSTPGIGHPCPLSACGTGDSSSANWHAALVMHTCMHLIHPMQMGTELFQ